ncbi:asparaginase [Endozoicomonas elysicola]|uniref:Asparaginase n=1 Tax=Endozoicomonas elysicola TaxID=305900 RepID=A0A081K5R7_9GAMM|nr:asparaginase [Endozoicomonas elysicola]
MFIEVVEQKIVFTLSIKKGSSQAVSQSQSISVQLIITGGTIDSYYDIDQCTTVPRESTGIPEFLEKYIKVVSENLEVREICMKDSRDINDDDIREVLDAILTSSQTHHVITHGTFTVFDTARSLSGLLPDGHEQVIVLTGAMWPLDGFAPNDAGFNLGFALGALRNQQPGVYVAFNGELFHPDARSGLH